MTQPVHTTSTTDVRHRDTSRILFLSNLLNEPLFTLYNFLSIILYKDLGASAFVISLLTMLKPVVTIFSFYWSAGVSGAKLKSNAMWAGIWMRAPFLLCPWVDHVWFVVLAAANYMLFYRAGVPAWLEILKRNLHGEKRDRMFSLSSGVAYAEGIVLSLAMGGLLDREAGMWKFLFFGAAAVGLISVALLGRVEVETANLPEPERLSWRERIIRPWRDSVQLLRERKDFSLFQWGFMIAGFGIMLIQPAIPVFVVDWLHVSYLEMAAAISIVKGFGFTLSSPLWARWFQRAPIFLVSSAVFVGFGLFPAVLALSGIEFFWFYVAYFFYGIAQAGSHLVWNMSGSYFAGKEPSLRYMGTGVMLAGVRGAVGPGLGGLLSVLWSPIQVLWIGSILCFTSGFWLLRKKKI